MRYSEEWCSTRVYNGAIAFLTYTNYLPKTTFNTNHNNNTKRILFVDDTSVIVNNQMLINSERDIVCLFVCFPGVTTHCGCIFHSPVAGFSLLVFEVS